MKTIVSRRLVIVIGLWLGMVSLSRNSVRAVALTVTTTNDNGPGSLRQAIQDASPGDTIEFSVTGAIALNGELLIAKDLNIVGPGPAQLAVDGNHSRRIFDISSNVLVAISHLTITNGLVHGADALPGPDINGGPALGGGLLNLGTLSLTNCVIVGNSCIGGSALQVPSNGGWGGNGNGGGIWNGGFLRLFNCAMINNSASGGAGSSGSGYSGPTFPGGTGGEGAGGAVYSTGNMVANNCMFGRNVVVGGTGGGAGASAGNRYAPGGAGGAGSGGAILNTNSSALKLTNCTFSANSASGGSGGGGFAQNCGGTGGAGSGGGIFASGGSLVIVNCTTASNWVSGGSGGQGGILPPGPSCPFGCPCVPPAGSSYGGGVLNQGATVSLRNSIIAGNGSSDFSGLANSSGHNLIAITNGSTGWLSTDLDGNSGIPLNARLGLLQDNGGPTLTHGLLFDSPAIDAGTSVGAPAFDQRGLPRNSGAHVDIGAFELQALTITELRKSGTDIVIRFSTEFGQRYRIERTDTLAPASWFTVADMVPGNGSAVQVTDPAAASQPQRFYRAVSVP